MIDEERNEDAFDSSLTSARFAFESRLDICLMNNHSPGLGQIGRQRVNISLSLSLSICPLLSLARIFSYKISRGKSSPTPVVEQRNEEQAKKREGSRWFRPLFT